jgi:hypothetical protein
MRPNVAQESKVDEHCGYGVGRAGDIRFGLSIRLEVADNAGADNFTLIMMDIVLSTNLL